MLDTGDETPPLADVPTPTVWVGLTHYNARGKVTGYSEDERVNPEVVRPILDSWPIAAVEELGSDDPEEAFEQLAGAIAAGGRVSWKPGERVSASATPDTAELTTYIAARKADEARRGAGTVESERVLAAVEATSLDLAKHAGRYQAQVGATAASIARQLHPDAKEVLVGTNDLTGEYTLVGVRGRDGAVSTDRIPGDDRLESCLQEMPWDSPQWLTFIDEDEADADLRDEHGAAYTLDITEVHTDANARLYEMENPA
ncbi:hypothetical protein [Pseudoclavibacter sp. VKM Ac-2867]|uniref:hypothetical protein n=1 Tax=Pseudoclavibacter sp. VKM Ac-2867 TaxID=2783829 RepID=UPI00188A154E|nr:hypothetical protein [Pseudoclavibacter sp. VKM Ac-2867]MBF4459434.1 hypothetical protein [Pseudoclavibacter sp. VKM Ac-2867]